MRALYYINADRQSSFAFMLTNTEDGSHVLRAVYRCHISEGKGSWPGQGHELCRYGEAVAVDTPEQRRDNGQLALVYTTKRQ